MNDKLSTPPEIMNLIPQPKKIYRHSSSFIFHENLQIFAPASVSKAVKALQAAVKKRFNFKLHWEKISITGSFLAVAENYTAIHHWDEQAKMKNHEAYNLKICKGTVSISGGGAAGVFYGIELSTAYVS